MSIDLFSRHKGLRESTLPDVRGPVMVRLCQAERKCNGIRLNFREVKAVLQVINDHGHIPPIKEAKNGN